MYFGQNKTLAFYILFYTHYIYIHTLQFDIVSIMLLLCASIVVIIIMIIILYNTLSDFNQFRKTNSA